MTLDRTRPWLYTEEQLMAGLPRWRRLELLNRFEQERQMRNYHAGAATYWHRRATDMLMLERDRSKHIEVLEQQVLGSA